MESAKMLKALGDQCGLRAKLVFGAVGAIFSNDFRHWPASFPIRTGRRVNEARHPAGNI
jgi:hypothetical protein